MTGAAHITQVLAEKMSLDETIHLLGESLPLSPVCASLLIEHPSRCHLLPAADATLVGVAIGLALAGKKPVVELSGPEALWGALQQIGQGAAHLSTEFNATLVLRVPLGPNAFDPSVLLSGIDNVHLVSPAEPADAGTLIDTALSTQGVTISLEPLTILGSSGGSPGDGLNARVAQEGEHVTLLAWGAGVGEAKRAAKTLSKEGISAEIIDLRSLSPLDVETVAQSINKTGRVVMVGGSGEMMNTTVSSAFLRLESPPTHVSQAAAAIVTKARAAIQY